MRLSEISQVSQVSQVREQGTAPWHVLQQHRPHRPHRTQGPHSPGCRRDKSYRKSVNYPFPILVRLTKAESEQIHREAKEAGLSVSRFMARTVTEHQYPPTVTDREALFSLRLQLERIGVNLNQMAKHLNRFSRGMVEAPPALSEIRGVVQVLRSLCRAVDQTMIG